MRIDVLGVGIDNLTLDEAVERGAGLAAGEKFSYAVTPNPEFLLAAKHTPAFRQALLGADLVLADGVGVVYSAKILGRPLKGKVPGIDFAQRLLAWMARHGKRLFLLGEDGPVVEEIRAAAADVVFVCLGAPKQELWMVEHGPATGAHLMVGLGGSLDVFAGVVERAPEGFQRLGLEWLYRLAKEPKRIGRMAKLPLVLVQAAGARLRGK